MVKGIRKALVSGFVACLVLATTLTAQAAVGRPFAGADRFETANKVLADGWTKADTAIIVEGYHYADALAVAPLASKENAPLIFLQNGDKAMLDSAMAKLNELGVKKVYIATGTGVLGTYVDDALKAKNIGVERLGGADRYETSAKIAAKIGTSTGVAIVTGSDSYADAVSIAPIAAQKGMPILFADIDTLRDSIKSAVKASGATSAYIVGGEGVIAKSVEALLPNPTRLGGVDKYETNYKVVDAFKGDVKFDKVYVASGVECADALAVSPLAAKTASPIVLADWEVNAQTADLLKANMTKDTDIRIVGGTGRVIPAVETKMDEIQKSIDVVTPPVGQSTINASVKDATVGSTVTVTVSGKDYEAAAKYAVYVNGKQSTAVTALGKSTTLYPKQANGATVTVKLYDADNKEIASKDVVLGGGTVVTDEKDLVVTTVKDATVGSTVSASIEVKGNADYATAAKYAIYVNGKQSTAITALGKSTTLYPKQAQGADVVVKLYTEAGTEVASVDAKLGEGATTPTTPTTPTTQDAADTINATVKAATVGSTVKVELVVNGNKDNADAVKYQVLVNGKVSTANKNLGESTTLYPAQAAGTQVTVNLLDSSNKVVKSYDVTLTAAN